MTFLLLLWSRFWSRSVETRAKDRLVWAYFKPLPITTSQYVVTAHRDWLFLSLSLPLSTLGDKRCAWQHRLGSRPRSSINCHYIFQCCSNRPTPHNRIYDMNFKVVYISLEQHISLLTSSRTSFRKIKYCCWHKIHLFKLLILNQLQVRNS